MVHLFLSSKEIINENTAIAEPSAMASRLIARRSHAYRVQPCFTCFRKMNIALCRLNETNISHEIQRMRKSITIENIDGFYHLPTKDNFQYFLIHLQSVGKIIARIVKCAKDAHRMFIELLHRANFIETLSMFFSVTAEVWTHSIKMCKSLVLLYNGCFEFYQEFYDEKNLANLPVDLRKWLDEDWIEHIDVNTDTITKRNCGAYGNVFLFNGTEAAGSIDVIENQTEMQSENDVKPLVPKFKPKITMNKIEKGKKEFWQIGKSAQNKRNEEKKRELHRMATAMEHVDNAISTESIDLGEKIDRNAFQKNNTIKKVFTLDLNQFKKVEQIRTFIDTEDNLRLKHKSKYSNGIHDNHWKQFKINCERLYILGQEKLIVKKFRNLWTQIKK